MQRRILWAYEVVTTGPSVPDQPVAVPNANGVVESSFHSWIDLVSYGLLFASILFVVFHLWKCYPFYKMVLAEVRSWLTIPGYRSNVSLSLNVDNGQIGNTSTLPVMIGLTPQHEIVMIDESDDEIQSDCSSDSYTSC